MISKHKPYFKNKIAILRHGQTEWNLIKKTQGFLDSPLTKKGIIQSQNAVWELKKYNFKLIISSPLGRALETAKTIAKGLNISEIKINPAFSERNLGIIQGHEKSELLKKFPRFWDSNGKFIHNSEVPQAESLNDFIHRVQKGIKELETLSERENILVITHSGVLRAIISYAQNIPFDKVAKTYNIDHCQPFFLN
jgi:probable phosphoglycerate mutase